MPRKKNPELIDADAPEATDEWFKKARPARDVLPQIVGADAARELLQLKMSSSKNAARLRAAHEEIEREIAVRVASSRARRIRHR